MDHVHTQQFAYSSISHCSSHQTLITRHVRAKETVESAGQKMVAVLCQSDWSTANQCVSHLFVVSLVKRTHIALVADTTDGKEWFLCFVFLLWKNRYVTIKANDMRRKRNADVGKATYIPEFNDWPMQRAHLAHDSPMMGRNNLKNKESNRKVETNNVKH